MLEVWYKQKDIVLKSFNDASYLANLKVLKDLPKPTLCSHQLAQLLPQSFISCTLGKVFYYLLTGY